MTKPRHPSRPLLQFMAIAIVALGLASVPATAEPIPGLPAASQSNVSDFPVLARLGRWDGTAFRPVAADSLVAGNAIFMAHGWSPGYRAPYEALQAKSTALITAWNPDLVNKANESMTDTWGPVAEALQAADPTAAVVLFSWIDQSATSENPLEIRVGEDATEVNGHRLATAIDQALAPNFYAAGGQVHLIGHSFGANVATTAALATTVPPRQLTLLDSPETPLTRLGGAKNDLRYKLPRLAIGRGPNQTFVDNYISLVGARYGGFPGLDQIVDVQTAPPKADKIGAKHAFALLWYQGSAEDLSAGVGYAWSPLLGADDTRLGSFYRQPNPAEPLKLDEVTGPPPAGVRTQLLISTTDLDVPGGQLSGPPGAAAAGTNGVAMGGSAPTTWNLTFTTASTSLWLDFSVGLAGTPGDSVALFIDGRQRYQTAVPADGRGDAKSFLILYDLTPGTHVLSATLSGAVSNTAANPATTATLSQLQLASSTPIDRNFTKVQTNDLIATAGVVVLVLVVLVIVLAVVLIRHLLRWVRRRRSPATATTGDETPDGSANSDPLHG